MKHISVGPSGIFGINDKDDVVYLTGTYGNPISTGEERIIIPSKKLKQLDVGANIIWGVDEQRKVSVLRDFQVDNIQSAQWVEVDGRMKHISVSASGTVWGVDNYGQIFHRVSASLANPLGDSWRMIEGKMTQVSVGEAGVWAINKENDIFYRDGTHGDTGRPGYDWTRVDGKFKYVSSGSNFVLAISTSNDLHIREGISTKNPKGVTWVKTGMKLKQVDHYGYIVVGTSENDDVYHAIA